VSLRALTILALFVLAALALALALREGHAQRVTIAAGPAEGEAYAIATAFAEVVERHHPELSVEVVETAGSHVNTRLLEEGRVELATVQADVRMGRAERLVALLYPDLFQLIVREDSGIRHVADLRGKRVALPPQGGGQYESFWFLAEHYELGADDVRAVPMSAASSSYALINGAVDAVFRVRAAGNPAILELIESVPTRIVPIAQAAALQLRQPALEPGIIPTGSYRGYPPIPESDMPTVAVQRLLVASRDLDARVVHTLTRVLFERRSELMNLTSLAGFISAPSLGGGTYVLVHPGAQRFYDRDRPSFVQENAEPLALLVTLAALLGSGILQLGSRRKKKRIDRYNKEVLDLGVQADGTTDPEELRDCRRRLFALAAAVVDDAEVGLISPDGFHFFWFTWSMVDGTLRRREATFRSPASPGDGA